MEEKINKLDIKDSTQQDSQEEMSNFEKILGLNKLGSLFLSADKFDKALIFLTKAIEIYTQKRESKEIPNFFFSNLFCNLAKAYSCLKKFDEAEKLYMDCIKDHPLTKIILRERSLFEENFIINLEFLISLEKIDLNKDLINKQCNLILDYFKGESDLFLLVKNNILKKFKGNNLSSISSFTHSIVNLAVIFQHRFKETQTAFNMYLLALIIEPNNEVANINMNNFLREIDLKNRSDEYITRRIIYDFSLKDDIKILDANNETSDNYVSNTIQINESISFITMKWGTKYGFDYVNKLYRAIKRNTTKSFIFYCITDDAKGLEEEIRVMKLNSQFKGWMKKSILFSPEYLSQTETEKICFIDLDMIVYSNIDFLFNYQGVTLLNLEILSDENRRH
jgi:tetratricopeptide (TPR) repeat protein